MESIYISICCLGVDRELERTIISALGNCSDKRKYDIRLGILCTGKEAFYQKMKDAYKSDPRIDWLYLSTDEQIGLGSARNIALSMYQGESFFLQIDSHTLFMKDWDTHLIDKLNYSKNFLKNHKVVLSCPLGDVSFKNGNEYGYTPYTTYLYGISPIQPANFLGDKKEDKIRELIKENEKYALQGKPSLPRIDERYLRVFLDYLSKHWIAPSNKICGHFIFSDFSFVESKSLPNDIFFWEDEFIQSMNLIESGFTLVYPGPSMPLCHSYFWPETKGWTKIDQLARETNDMYKKVFKSSDNEVLEKSSNNLYNFVNNPKNNDKIEGYLTYSGIDLKSAKMDGPRVSPGPRTRKNDPLFPIHFSNSPIEIGIDIS
jgi:hypothetical protein